MKVINISEDDGYKFDKEVNKKYNNKHNFIKFYHPNCHHCIAMSETWNKLPNELNKKKYKNLNIVKIHANALSDINSNCCKNIMGFPTIRMVKPGGEHYQEFNGERDTESLKEFIKNTYKDDKIRKTKKKKPKTVKRKTKKKKPKTVKRKTEKQKPKAVKRKTEKRKPKAVKRKTEKQKSKAVKRKTEKQKSKAVKRKTEKLKN